MSGWCRRACARAGPRLPMTFVSIYQNRFACALHNLGTATSNLFFKRIMLSRVTIWVAMFIVAVWVIIENYLIIYQDEVSLDDDMHYVKTRQRQGLEDVCQRQREDENGKSKYPTLTSTSSHTSSFSSIQNATVI
eukprot:scaffold3557_cov144-Skeletonema_marinoi.AAC.2